MSDIGVARRYAAALGEEAEREGVMSAVDEDVDLIRQTLEDSRELAAMFRSPILSRDKKKRILKSLFGERVHPLTGRFLQLLVNHQREDIISAVVGAYAELRDRQQGILEAVARVPQPLSDEEARKLTAALERKTGKRIRLVVRTDPKLIGGIVIRVGDLVYDRSVRHQLDTLREQMETGSYVANGA